MNPIDAPNQQPEIAQLRELLLGKQVRTFEETTAGQNQKIQSLQDSLLMLQRDLQLSLKQQIDLADRLKRQEIALAHQAADFQNRLAQTEQKIPRDDAHLNLAQAFQAVADQLHKNHSAQ